jgi:PPOX class probable F420-dependent enzyme
VSKPPSPPVASRPFAPGYELADPAGGEGLLPWSWAVERLAAAHNYWVASVRPDGRPHAMPVWAVWLEGALCFSTGARSRKARNLAADPRCVITTERADEAVVVEGVAEPIEDAAEVVDFLAAYNAKYRWDMDASWAPFLRVRPQLAFGFIENPGRFAATATRWRFEAR